MPEISLTISRGYLTICKGQHMNSFTAAAASLFKSHLWSGHSVGNSQSLGKSPISEKSDQAP